MFLEEKYWQSYKSPLGDFLSNGRSRYGRLWRRSWSGNCISSSVFRTTWQGTPRTTRLNEGIIPLQYFSFL